MIAQALRDFLLLFATVEPIGSMAIFVAITAQKSPSERWRIGWRAVLLAGVVLLAFLLLGETTLAAIGVRLSSFQLAGGIILFLFSLQMIFGTAASQSTMPNPASDSGQDIAVFPLAIPGIASPGAILAVVLLTENQTHTWGQQMITVVMLLAVLGIVLGLFAIAGPVHKLIGTAGENVLVRVMGILLAALATEEAVQGIAALIQEAR